MNERTLRCRSCSTAELVEVLDLGLQPLANRLVRAGERELDEPRFPLRLVVCTSCWLLQLAELVPPEELFSHYLYFSSNSDEMLAHAETAATAAIARYGLGSDDLVVEIASNDGYLLKHFHAAGIPSLGIEPAANIAEVTQALGIETIVEYFGADLAHRLAAADRLADLVLGNNVFAHAPDTNDFVAGLAAVLAPGGRIELEFPYAIDFVAHAEFDTIYHEHVFYFSLVALEPLFARHGLTIASCERLAIHGGSLRIVAAHDSDAEPDARVVALLADERSLGVDDLAHYRGFADSVHRLGAELTEMLGRLRADGHTIAAYGASAKGSTLLNTFGIGAETIDFVVDRSQHKQGYHTPGTHLPILDPDQLLARAPDYTLLLTWNFADEILEQQRAYRKAGGRFIVPLPELRVC